MADWEAPAKLNLDLQVRARDSSGHHPLRSLVQTIDWCDGLVVEEDDEDSLAVSGADLSDGGDNLVWKAIQALRKQTGRSQPKLAIKLEKRIAVAAGLGGGSSDAAAALLSVAELGRIARSAVDLCAQEIGADVPYFLVGGTARMEGHGERISAVAKAPRDYAVAVVVPPFELSTGDVYRRWDQLEGPVGREVEGRRLPPGLRSYGPLRNDLTPAAIALRPELDDWKEDLASTWERPVMMSGSGPALFGFFTDLDEARSASAAVKAARAVAAADLRSTGAALRER